MLVRNKRSGVVWNVIYATIAVFALSLFAPSIVDRLAFVPTSVLNSGGVEWLNLITYMFVHGGFFHIFFNMWFLAVLGEEVEEVFGGGIFLATYFLSGIAGVLYYLFVSLTPVAVIGASAGVSGILGFYMIFFPRREMVFLLFGLIPARMSMVKFAGVWIGIQLLGVLSGASGVGWEAHIVGFVVGAIVALIYKKIFNPPVYILE